VALFAYLSVYWFAVDAAAAGQLPAQSAASESARSQSADSVDEAHQARTAV
jgi:hypothetical protein